jgi:hypothetical protein
MNKSSLWQDMRRHSWMVILATQVFVQVAIVGVAHRSIAVDQQRQVHSMLSRFLIGRGSD